MHSHLAVQATRESRIISCVQCLLMGGTGHLQVSLTIRLQLHHSPYAGFSVKLICVNNIREESAPTIPASAPTCSKGKAAGPSHRRISCSVLHLSSLRRSEHREGRRWGFISTSLAGAGLLPECGHSSTALVKAGPRPLDS